MPIASSGSVFHRQDVVDARGHVVGYMFRRYFVGEPRVSVQAPEARHAAQRGIWTGASAGPAGLDQRDWRDVPQLCAWAPSCG
jgi:hypothetical protein